VMDLPQAASGRRLSPGLALALLFAGLGGAACGGGDDGEPIPPHLSTIESEIFARNCTFSSCHGATSPNEGMSLVAPTYATLVGVASSEAPDLVRIAPGDPDASYLLQKITSTAPRDGVRMPPDQPLPSNKVEAIRAWIAAGAPND
jgi:cytochrome c